MTVGPGRRPPTTRLRAVHILRATTQGLPGAGGLATLPPMPPLPRNPRWQAALAVAAVLAVAALLRLWHLASLQEAWQGTQLFHLARGDAATHWREAQQVLDGDPFLADRVPWKGPGYSWFLAGLMQLVGRDPGALRWPLAWLGALNCAALVLVGWRALGGRWAVVAGLLGATNGVLLLFDAELFFPTLLATLNLPALWLLARPGAGWRAHAGAGALLGLAVLVHPVYLMPAALLSLFAWRRQGRAALALPVVVALCVAPITLQNLLVHRQPILVTWNGGINLYVGNQPGFGQGDGQRIAAWERVLNSTAEAGIEPEYRRDRFYQRQALRDALARPLATAATWVDKLRHALGPHEIANNIRLYEYRELSRPLAWSMGEFYGLWWPGGLWWPAMLLGLLLWWRRGDALAAVGGWWALGLLLTMLLSFVTARYRAPLYFVGALWVAAFLRELWRDARARTGWRRFRWPLAWLAGVFLWMPLGAVQGQLPPPWSFEQARVAEVEGRPGPAREWWGRAREVAGSDPALRMEYAGFLLRQGDVAGAAGELAGLLSQGERIEPEFRWSAHVELARLAARQGDAATAREHYAAAMALDIDDARWRGEPWFDLDLPPVRACRLRLELAQLELASGRRDEATRLVRRVQEDCPSAGDAIAQPLRGLELSLGIPARR